MFFIMWLATSVPRGQSCKASNCHVARTMPSHTRSGVKDIFQTNFFLQGCFFKKNFTETKIKTRLKKKITKTKIIFKKKNSNFL